MSVIADFICYSLVAGSLFLILHGLTSKRKRHNWYEVKSSDVANAERKKKRGE